MWYERGWQWAKEHLTITAPGVVLIFAATYIVMLAVNAGEVGAAWVQAVGSIAAIGVAIWISHRQAQRELHERRERECVYMHKAFNSASMAAVAARTAYTEILNDLNNQRAVQIYLAEIRHSKEELDRFSYAELADMHFAGLFTIIQRTTRIVISEIEEFLEGRSPNFLFAFVMTVEKAEETIGGMRLALQDYSAMQGVDIRLD